MRLARLELKLEYDLQLKIEAGVKLVSEIEAGS